MQNQFRSIPKSVCIENGPFGKAHFQMQILELQVSSDSACGRDSEPLLKAVLLHTCLLLLSILAESFTPTTLAPRAPPRTEGCRERLFSVLAAGWNHSSQMSEL